MATYDCAVVDSRIQASAQLEHSSLKLSRSIQLGLDGRSVEICETVENLLSIDRPIAWTQHVTLGPPFSIPGITRIQLDAVRSKVSESPCVEGPLKPGADFTWPIAPSRNSGTCDLSIFADEDRRTSLTTHRMR